MRMRGAAVVLALALAGPAGAADLDAGGAGRGAVVLDASAVGEPTPLEWLRTIHPREGRDVVVTGDGVRVPTIEWRHPVEVRVRAESGAALSEREKVAIRELALICRRGEVVGPTEQTEQNGTFVIEYGCAWLQGFDGLQ